MGFGDNDISALAAYICRHIRMHPLRIGRAPEHLIGMASRSFKQDWQGAPNQRGIESCLGAGEDGLQRGEAGTFNVFRHLRVIVRRGCAWCI